MRKIVYVTGTRADFGLMKSTLELINNTAGLELGILVTGMHLDSHYGNTVDEIADSGLAIIARVPVELRSDDGGAMAKAIGTEIIGMVNAFVNNRPDIVMLLGDRGEMLAGAIAALHLNIPIVHIHGGERSGTVDEPIRHAISKLSHYHFTATDGARERLIKMGEHANNIFVTGAPGLDGITDLPLISRDRLISDSGLQPNLKVALVVFHPVVQEAEIAANQMTCLLDALSAIENLQLVILMPNADAGGEAIRSVIEQNRTRCKVYTHLVRNEFLSWMSVADVMVGNSSSGIIEAASFGTPVVNVGQRQVGRERSANVVDVDVDQKIIESKVRQALKSGRGSYKNVYGDGKAGKKIVHLLETLPLNNHLMMKSNAY